MLWLNKKNGYKVEKTLGMPLSENTSPQTIAHRIIIRNLLILSNLN
jgi:hypothetical protein